MDKEDTSALQDSYLEKILPSPHEKYPGIKPARNPRRHTMIPAVKQYT